MATKNVTNTVIYVSTGTGLLYTLLVYIVRLLGFWASGSIYDTVHTVALVLALLRVPAFPRSRVLVPALGLLVQYCRLD